MNCTLEGFAQKKMITFFSHLLNHRINTNLPILLYKHIIASQILLSQIIPSVIRVNKKMEKNSMKFLDDGIKNSIEKNPET